MIFLLGIVFNFISEMPQSGQYRYIIYPAEEKLFANFTKLSNFLIYIVSFLIG